MLYLFGILIFLLGACLGSFITVIANRYNTGLSFWKGRSFCFTCNTELKTKDLFPLFSFLFLKGRCRYCESKIPKETFVIEILMGVLSVVAAFKSGLVSLELGAMTVEIVLGYFLITAIFAVILLISVYDLKHFIIPDSFLITFLISSFLYLFVSFNLSIFNVPLFSLRHRSHHTLFVLVPYFQRHVAWVWRCEIYCRAGIFLGVCTRAFGRHLGILDRGRILDPCALVPKTERTYSFAPTQKSSYN